MPALFWLATSTTTRMIRSFMDAYCSYRSVSELTPVDVENKGPTVTKKRNTKIWQLVSSSYSSVQRRDTSKFMQGHVNIYQLTIVIGEGGGVGGGLTGKFVSFYTQFLPFSPAQDDLHLKT